MGIKVGKDGKTRMVLVEMTNGVKLCLGPDLHLDLKVIPTTEEEKGWTRNKHIHQCASCLVFVYSNSKQIPNIIF